MLNKIILTFILFLSSLILTAAQSKENFRIEGKEIAVEFDNGLKSRIISKVSGEELLLGNFTNSEYLISGGKAVEDFKLVSNTGKDIRDNIGEGKEYTLTGTAGGPLKKTISIISYNEFPAALFFRVTYENTGKTSLTYDSWVNNHYSFFSKESKKDAPAFWSYLPGSYGWDNDWLQKLDNGFERENYLGMNNVDYGGGTPVVDIWRPDAGIAVGHVELVQKFVSLPVSVKDGKADLAIKYNTPISLKPGDSFSTFRTFVSVHKGDYFRTLTGYSKFMAKQGIEFRKAPEEAYGTEWCGWGYEKNFTMEKFYGTFPIVKKLGFDCITLDYGWESAVGDYYLPKDKFPGGDADMRKVVDSIHSAGAKSRLWWMPLSVYPKTDLFTEHPEYMLLNKDQSPVFIQFWKSFFLCPASEEVKKLTKDFVVKAIRDWKFDGLKIDGNNLNTVPPCYNAAHKHAYPEESTEKLAELYKLIYETALSINPEAVIQICPCGTNQAFHILPYMNQTVASDPHSSWHVRIKGKTIMGLTQSKIPFAGDHVELSDDKSDFASTVGIGGVIATKFTWPVGAYVNKETGDVTLTPEKEKEWAKWLKIYNENMLSKGIYRGELYDIGYDRPETHAVQKDNVLYYSFYGNDYNGEVELRGLEDKTYIVSDYENNIQLGTIKGPAGKLKVNFKKHLLIKAEPKL
jgi:alpha-galactosidase